MENGIAESTNLYLKGLEKKRSGTGSICLLNISGYEQSVLVAYMSIGTYVKNCFNLLDGVVDKGQ